MTKLLILLSIFISSNLLAECVHERTIYGSDLIKLADKHEVFIESKNAQYIHLSKLKVELAKKYTVQLFDKVISTRGSVKNSNDPHAEYNRKYLEYYTYARMQKYIQDNKEKIQEAGYEVRVVGKSIRHRELYAITPKVLKDKKTILMFGRHHGDEGTANWIIEGFFDEYLSNESFRNKYQLLLYPMINPEGAEAHTRYNANGRDLNRSWDKSLAGSYDEIKYIHTDLKNFMSKIKDQVFIALDMHGSFTEDFIYRVKKNYVSRLFFNTQQNFIDELSIFDPWQNGNDKKSNGDPAMARLVLIDHYKKNAMTHESIRNISKDNNQGRSLGTLREQGVGLIKSIQNLY
jgi:hypothetical protein